MSDFEMFKEYDAMSIQDLAQAMKEIKEELDTVSERRTELNKRYDHIRLARIPEKMDEEGINTITLKDIGRLTLTSDVYAAIPSDKQEEAWEWLRENGHAGLIKETVHAGTLKAFAKAMLTKGEVLPDDLFRITPFSRASITKIK